MVLFPSATEVTVGSSTLYLCPRDVAKIGQMYLHGGIWEGTRAMSEGWVRQPTQEGMRMVASESPVPDLNPGYGYLWWLGAFTTGDTETHFAAGWSGQFIFLVPEPGMVVVFTPGGFENWDCNGPLQTVNHYVLPATGR